MSVQTVGRKFVEMCSQGKNFDVMRTMYAPEIVSVEGDGKETAGQAAVIKKSEVWVSDKIFHGEKSDGGRISTGRINLRCTLRLISRLTRRGSALR